jgi:hypothetical protein
MLSLLEWRRQLGLSGVVNDNPDTDDVFTDSQGMLSQRLFSCDGNDSLRFFDFLDGKEGHLLNFFDVLFKLK